MELYQTKQTVTSSSPQEKGQTIPIEKQFWIKEVKPHPHNMAVYDPPKGFFHKQDLDKGDEARQPEQDF